jgi:hypothetical protein
MLSLLKRDSLNLTAEKLGKQELDGHETGPLVLVQTSSLRGIARRARIHANASVLPRVVSLGRSVRVR